MIINTNYKIIFMLVSLKICINMYSNSSCIFFFINYQYIWCFNVEEWLVNAFKFYFILLFYFQVSFQDIFEICPSLFFDKFIKFRILFVINKNVKRTSDHYFVNGMAGSTCCDYCLYDVDGYFLKSKDGEWRFDLKIFQVQMRERFARIHERWWNSKIPKRYSHADK